MIDEAKIKKIRAIAEDERGDPQVRLVAKDFLRRYDAKHPPPPPPPSTDDFEDLGDFEDVPAYQPPPPKPAPAYQPQAPGVRPAQSHFDAAFHDLSRWKISFNNPNNLTTTAFVNGREWRVTIFQYKKTPGWGWSVKDTYGSDPVIFSPSRYSSRDDAHRGLWAWLKR